MSQGTTSMQLKDQVAIVTGSATGIGAACAERLAAQGARVVVNCTKSVSDAEATIDRIRNAGGEALLVQANVAEDADCRRMAAAAVEKWGRIDILVNNAGTTRFADHSKLDLLSADDLPCQRDWRLSDDPCL
jgi:3-oxoacyl-[acyl-carrier protein] reductase